MSDIRLSEVKLLHTVQHQDKSAGLKFADGALWLASAALGYEDLTFKTANSSATNEPLFEGVKKVQNCALRILCTVAAIVTLPLALIGIIVKLCLTNKQAKEIQEVKAKILPNVKSDTVSNSTTKNKSSTVTVHTSKEDKKNLLSASKPSSKTNLASDVKGNPIGGKAKIVASTEPQAKEAKSDLVKDAASTLIGGKGKKVYSEEPIGKGSASDLVTEAESSAIAHDEELLEEYIQIQLIEEEAFKKFVIPRFQEFRPLVTTFKQIKDKYIPILNEMLKKEYSNPKAKEALHSTQELIFHICSLLDTASKVGEDYLKLSPKKDSSVEIPEQEQQRDLVQEATGQEVGAAQKVAGGKTSGNNVEAFDLAIQVRREIQSRSILLIDHLRDSVTIFREKWLPVVRDTCLPKIEEILKKDFYEKRKKDLVLEDKKLMEDSVTELIRTFESLANAFDKFKGKKGADQFGAANPSL